MEIGISTFVTDEGIGPADLARAVEERGFDALFAAEHTHIPVSRDTPYPAGGDLPRIYYRSLDPLVLLSAAAAVTERIALGTGIALIPQRDPIVLAKEVASLDLISSGRAELGIGAGWNIEEMRNHGTDPATRTALMRERVLAMKELWTREQAEFHGRFVDFDPVYSWPKPVRRPHPPVLIGGGGPTVLDRVLDYGDGWMPIWTGDAEHLRPRVAELHQRAAEGGRARPSVTVFSVPGRLEHCAAAAELGADRVLIQLGTRPRDETLHRLDELAELAAKLG